MALTQQEKDYIKENYGKVSRDQMAKVLKRSSRDISAAVAEWNAPIQKAKLFIETGYFTFDAFTDFETGRAVKKKK